MQYVVYCSLSEVVFTKFQDLLRNIIFFYYVLMCKTFEVKEGVLSLHFDCVFRGDSNIKWNKRGWITYVQSLKVGQ